MSIKKRRTEKFMLDNEGIDGASELLSEALCQAKAERKDAVRLRLAVEEILLLWKDNTDGAPECSFTSAQRIGYTTITIAMPGPKLDPAELCGGEDGIPLYSALSAYGGVFPSYDYVNGENRIILNPDKSRGKSSTGALLLTIAAAVAAGLLCRMLPQGISEVIRQIVNMVFSSIMRALKTMAGPLVFLTVCVGLINIGDLSALSRIGKTVLLRCLSRVFIVTVIAVSCVAWFFVGSSSTAVSPSDAVMHILEMVLDIIPKDIVTPFINGNSLQIIFMAVCLGIAVLVLGDKVTVVRSAITQAKSLVQGLMKILGKLIDILIFTSVFSIVFIDNPSELGGLVKGYGMLVCVLLVCPFIYALIAAKRLKVSYPLFLSKIMPGYILALTTASSTAALPTVMERCENNIGISRELTNFAIPLCQVLFKAGTSIYLTMTAFIYAEHYGIAINLPWVIAAVVCSGFLSSTTPPIPGGTAAVFAILLAQAGIPAQALSLVLAGNVFMDFIVTGCNVSCMQSEAALTADKLGLLNRDILRGK